MKDTDTDDNSAMWPWAIAVVIIAVILLIIFIGDDQPVEEPLEEDPVGMVEPASAQGLYPDAPVIAQNVG